MTTTLLEFKKSVRILTMLFWRFFSDFVGILQRPFRKMCPDLATTFRRSTHRDLNWHENTRYATKTSGRAGMILILITKISASGACILTNRDKISEHHGVCGDSDGLPTGWTSDLENGSWDGFFFNQLFFYFVRHSTLLGCQTSSKWPLFFAEIVGVERLGHGRQIINSRSGRSKF